MGSDQMSMFLQRMDDRVSISRAWFREYKFHLVESVAQLAKLVDMCIKAKVCSLDIESTGVDNRVYPDEFFGDGVRTRHGMRTVDRIAGVCMSFDGLNGYYVPLSHEPDDSGNLPWDPAWDELTRLVFNCKCIFHHSKFDQEFLYPVTGKEYWTKDEFEDTYLMAKVVMPLKSTPAGLKPLIKANWGIDTIEIGELFTQERKEQLKREKRGPNFALLHPKEGLEYGCQDGIFTYKLEPVFRPKLQENDLRIYNLEKAFVNVLRKMERNRVHVDVERVQQLYTECKAAIEQVGDAIRDTVEHHTGRTGKWLTLNIGSPKQMSMALLTDPEGLRLKPTAKMLEAEGEGGKFQDPLSGDSDDDDGYDTEMDDQRQYTLKDEAIKSLNEAYGERFRLQRAGVVDKEGKPKVETMFDLILEYRHYDKMKGSFVEKLFLSHDKYGDVRPNFNQMGTDTARLSSTAGKIDQGYSGINFQGIPRDSDEDKPDLFKQIRTCIVPRPGWMLVKLDFAGEELRVMANMSGDKIWTKSFLYEDGDVHSITSRILFNKGQVNKDERNRGKRSNFAIIYGGGAGAIQRNIGCSIEDAQRHMDNLRHGIPEIMGYVEEQKTYARRHKCIITAFGRRIPIPTIDSPIRGIRAKAERCAINYTIQSTSADVLKFAMCYVDKNIRKLGWEDRVRYVLTVHDEVVFEIRPEYLMEIVRKLDEWMTYPWQLPKASGRKWIVPLLTEPGIDINWKARFDYFKMVDGTPVKPSEIAEDGTYKGKLKKDEEFVNGRIYQKVPDFLQQWIRKAGPGLPAAPEAPALPAPAVQAPALPAAPEGPTLREQLEARPEPEPIPVRSESPPLATSTSPEPIKEPEVQEAEATPSLDLSDLDSSPSPEPEDHLPSLDDSMTDLKLDEPDAPAQAAPEPKPEPKKAVEHLGNGAPKVNGSNGTVHRWVLTAVMSEYTQRKLHAIITLAEGEVPLRIVGPKGDVLVPDSEGLRVNPQEFDMLARLFGLG